MNFILIISDTLRPDHLSCYGNTRMRTPYLERFAREAVVFDRAHCGSFPTVQCRNDVLTGRWTFAYKAWQPVGDEKVLLPQLLNKAGFLTALFADTPHPFAPGMNYQKGFKAWDLIRGQEADAWKTSPPEVSLPCNPAKLRGGARGATYRYLQNVSWRRSEEDYFPARTMRAAASWLEENKGSPFFLYVDTFDPHEPWDPPKHYLELYEPDGYQGEEVIYPNYDRWASFMTEQELAHCRNLYAGEVSLVDRWIGHLLSRIEDLGILDETVIMITSDHGFYFGEHGYIGKSIIRTDGIQSLPLYPEVSRIPLLVRMPKGKGAGRRRAFAQHVDFMPTILELLGAPVPPEAQGQSLVPVLLGKTDAARPIAVSAPTISTANMAALHPTNRATVTTDEWALVIGPAEGSVGDSGLRSSAVDSVDRKVESLEGSVSPELYHLPSDPWCTRNVLAMHRQEARKVHSAFGSFLRGTDMRQDHLARFLALPQELKE